MTVNVRHHVIDTDEIQALAKQLPEQRDKNKVRDAVYMLVYKVPVDHPDRDFLLEMKEVVRTIYYDALKQPDEQRRGNTIDD